jgi:DNA modification methylase
MLRPKMRADFTAFVFCDADKTTQLHQTLVDTGWPVLRQAIWHRPNLAKKRTGSMTFLSSYEPFWHCGTRHLNLPEEWGEERFDVQKYVVPQSTHKDDQSFHPTQKPLGLMQRLVEIGSYQSELVVDPFCGAGTTALAAYSKDRFCITGDTNADYVAIAKGRISEHKNAK